jgi:hypothetical protein
MSGSKFFWYMICTGVGAGGAAAGVWGWNALANVLILAFVLGVVWIVADSLWERHNDELDYRRELVRERNRFAQTIGSLDKEARYFLAHEWPEMGVEFGEEALTYVLKDGVNTQVLVSFLRVFLEDSSASSFVDLRNYNDDKYLQERFEVSRDVVRTQWGLATAFLAQEKYLKPDSMAGNRTWQWTTKEHYKKMVRRYVGVKELQVLE